MSVVVFCASLAAILYVIAGYPLLLAWLARRPRPVAKRFEPKPVSIVIPVHNGGRYLRGKLDSILRADYPQELVEVAVVSDGSTDGTAGIAREYANRGVKLLEIPRAGKPSALTAGIAQTRNEILVLTDVRQALAPDSLRELVACFSDPEVGVASGDIVIVPGAAQDERDVGVFRRYESWIRSKLTRVDSMLGATGAFYAIRRELAVPLPAETLLDDMYLPLAAFFRGYRVVLNERARVYDIATSAQAEFKRKVRTLAGNYQLLRFYPHLLGAQNRMRFHYVSYKLGRLALPFALLAAAASTPFLPGQAGIAAGIAQAFFYTLAAVDFLVPNDTPVKRLSSLAKTFLTMMAAAFCALAVFFVPPDRLWKVTGAAATKAVR